MSQRETRSRTNLEAKRKVEAMSINREGLHILEEWWASLHPHDRLSPSRHDKHDVLERVKIHDPSFDIQSVKNFIHSRNTTEPRLLQQQKEERRSCPLESEDWYFSAISPQTRQNLKSLLSSSINPPTSVVSLWAGNLGLPEKEVASYITYLQENTKPLVSHLPVGAKAETDNFSTRQIRCQGDNQPNSRENEKHWSLHQANQLHHKVEMEDASVLLGTNEQRSSQEEFPTSSLTDDKKGLNADKPSVKSEDSLETSTTSSTRITNRAEVVLSPRSSLSTPPKEKLPVCKSDCAPEEVEFPCTYPMNISSISERTRSKRARYMIESDSDGASIGTLDDDHSRGESVTHGCHSNLDNSPGPITRSRAKALSKRHKPESTHKRGKAAKVKREEKVDKQDLPLHIGSSRTKVGCTDNQDLGVNDTKGSHGEMGHRTLRCSRLRLDIREKLGVEWEVKLDKMHARFRKEWQAK